VEFALVWPIALLLVLGCVELAIWGAEAYAVRAAALAGARAGSVAGASPDIAARLAQRALAPSLVGASASVWCPGTTAQPDGVWVCATDLGSAIEVDVGGTVPALVPIVISAGLPVHAHAVIQKETFAR
jgi:Flp pilus assembly protein TadG